MVKKKKRGSLLSRVRKKLLSRKKKPASNIKKIRKVRKPAKRVIKKPSKAKEEKFEVGFEEVVIKCPSCGREFRIVKSSGFSAEGMLCQRCAAGGTGFEEEGDI